MHIRILNVNIYNLRAFVYHEHDAYNVVVSNIRSLYENCFFAKKYFSKIGGAVIKKVICSDFSNCGSSNSVDGY